MYGLNVTGVIEAEKVDLGQSKRINDGLNTELREDL